MEYSRSFLSLIVLCEVPNRFRQIHAYVDTSLTPSLGRVRTDLYLFSSSSTTDSTDLWSLVTGLSLRRHSTSGRGTPSYRQVSIWGAESEVSADTRLMAWGGTVGYELGMGR